MSLPSGQLFAFYKVDEGFMIHEDLYGDFSTLQVWLSVFKATDDHQQLLVIDFIIAFCRYEVLTKEGHGVQQAIVFVLQQDTSADIIWGVTFQNRRLSLIKMSEYWWFSHRLLEEFKGFLAGIRSVKPLVLAAQLRQWAGDFAKVLDEPPEEVAEVNKELHLLEALRGVLVYDHLNLLRVHLQPINKDHQA